MKTYTIPEYMALTSLNIQPVWLDDIVGPVPMITMIDNKEERSVLFGTTSDDVLDLHDQGSLVVKTGLGDDDIQIFGIGDNIVFAGSGVDNIATEDGNDILYGGTGDDCLSSGAGTDILYGGDGDDTLCAMGNATMHGGDGDDYFTTDENSCTIYGDAGDDSIYTFGGSDSLYGGSGDDVLDAGDGNDLIVGGVGVDMLYGGIGRDTFVFDSKSGNDIICDFQEGDVLQIDRDGYDISIEAIEQTNSYLLNWHRGSEIVSSVIIETIGQITLSVVDSGFIGQAL